jgi:hypothetical protein
VIRVSLIVKATVSSAAATVGTTASNTTPSSRPRRLAARIHAMVLDPFQRLFPHGSVRDRPSP